MKDPNVKERMIEEDGKLHIVREQDVTEILRQTKYLQSESPKSTMGDKWRLAGRIPLVVAEQWSRECGAGIGTKEFGEYAKKKLKDSDYAYLRVRGY